MFKRLGFDSAGVFFVEFNVAGERGPRHERIDFKPSTKVPTITDHVAQELERVNLWNRVERLEIRKNGGNGIACMFAGNQVFID